MSVGDFCSKLDELGFKRRTSSNNVQRLRAVEILQDFEFEPREVYSKPGQLVVVGLDEDEEPMAVIEYATSSNVGTVNWDSGRIAYAVSELESMVCLHDALLRRGLTNVTTGDLLAQHPWQLDFEVVGVWFTSGHVVVVGEKEVAAVAVGRDDFVPGDVNWANVRTLQDVQELDTLLSTRGA